MSSSCRRKPPLFRWLGFGGSGEVAGHREGRRGIWGRSPAGVRPLRVTDSPFPVVPEDGAGSGNERVNAEAEDFIRRFYEQLRMQHPSVATPEYY